MSRASRFSVFGRKSTTTNPKEHRQKYLQPTIAQGLQIVLGGLKTGDILLYNTASRASYCSGEHDWTRAGLVIRVSEKLVERYAIDTPPTHSSTRLAVLEADPKTGKVELFPLELRLAKTIDTIQYLALRRRRGNELSANSIEKLESFALSALGRQFKPSLFARLCCCCCGTSRREMFFISELIEDALQELGVLAKPQRALDEVSESVRFDPIHALARSLLLVVVVFD